VREILNKKEGKSMRLNRRVIMNVLENQLRVSKEVEDGFWKNLRR
jgi:hypothetical protein